jgi:Cu(I)/Ag(I) efflux system membrane fusion protein
MTTQTEHMPPPGEMSPFLPQSGRQRSRAVGVGLFLLVLAAATIVTWYLVGQSATTTADGGHNHGAASIADSASPVMLSDESARRIGVTFAPVQVSPLEREVRTVAIVGYDETLLKSVTARVDGWVEQLHVNFTGQAVRIGDPLFSLYSPMLVAAQQELLLARRLRDQVTGGTGDAVKGTDDLIESARRRLLYWEVPADEVRAIEEQGEIRKALTFRSPVHGVVIEKLVLGGQRIMAGEPVYRIADLRTVWLEGEIYERDLAAVSLGLPVTAEFPALPGTTRTGRITYIYPTVNPETRTARVRVELSNPGLALKPGMYATFRFAAASDPVMNVPRSALLATGERNLVFVRRPDGMFAPRDVVLGIATDDRIEILSGLALGDTVVASATFLVDAESNLGSLLGGMGNMPGMDIAAPATGPTKGPTPPAPRPAKDSMAMPMPDADGGHAGHASPGGE